MRLLTNTIYLLILFLGIRCGSTPCAVANGEFSLIGFSDPESERIILRRYAKGTQFAQQLDTLIIPSSLQRSHDTLYFGSLPGEAVMFSGYDYEIELPLANRLYRITDIQEEQRTVRHSIFSPRKDNCVNNIIGLKVNQLPHPVYGQFLIYLRK